MFFSVLRIVLLLVLLTSSTLVGATHPRLYFSESDLPQLRQAARSSKKIQFNRLQAWGDANLGQKPPEKIGTVERHHETALSAITAFGFLYQIKEQEKYLSAGRRWLDALLATPTESGGNYHIGVFAASLAHGYDLFYNGLDEHFRRQLMVKTIDVLKEARYGADHHWWGGIYTHHDFWIPVAGMGIAALCLGDEYKDADTLLSYCVGELGRAMELLGTQGYWPEGVADWVYLLSTPLMFFDALNRVGGKDFYLYDWMKNTARVRAYHWMPDDSYMFVGDSYRSGRYGTLGSVSAHVIMRLAARYRDPVAQWLALREAHVDSSAGRDLSLQAPYAFGDMRPLDSRQVHGLPWQFLWYDPTLRPEPPAKLPHDIKFSNWGSALLRSGWSDRNPVLFFAGGHMLGRLGTEAWQTNPRLRGGLAHTHQNAGALYWWADGNFLLCPPSYGGRDGRFHSTVMIDGHGQLYEPGHRVDIEHFESGHGWSYVSMELAGAYPGEVGLDRFHRQVVYLKPRTVVLCDRLTTHGGAKKYIRRYEWLLHTDAGIGEWQAGGDTIAVVHRDTGEKLLTGKIFPSTRYFFERQSMDRPDGRPMVRALSTTFIGRLPVEVEIAAVLHAPARDEDKISVSKFQPDNQTDIIVVNFQENSHYSIVFAKEETLEYYPNRFEGYIICGLRPDTRYDLISKPNGSILPSYQFVPDEGGKYKTSAAGVLYKPGKKRTPKNE